MVDCDMCLLFSEEINRSRQEIDDISDKERTFCDMYDDAIPTAIQEGKKHCPFFTEKDDAS